MVLHTCELCNFSSRFTTNYNSHCMSKKHLRSLEKIENEKSKVCDSQMNLIDSRMTPIDSRMTPIDSRMTINDSQLILKVENEYICEYCNKKMSKNSNLHRHYSICKKKKEYHDSEILKDLEIKRLEEEVNKLKNKSTMNTTTNNIQINTYIKNDKVLNYLNTNYGDAIEMDCFINRLKNDTFLSHEMMDCFVACYNNGGTESFGSTLVKYLNQICKQLNINIFPLCCSDSNLRSHKEKNSVGWETVIDTNKIEEIIHNIVTDIFMEKGQMIYLDARDRKKICNIVKKSYGLSNLQMIDDFSENSEIYIPLEE